MIKRAYVDAVDLSTYNNIRNLVFEILNQTQIGIILARDNKAKLHPWPEKLNSDFSGRIQIVDSIPTESTRDKEGIYLRFLEDSQFAVKKTKREIFTNTEYLKFTNKRPVSDLRLTELKELTQLQKPLIIMGSIWEDEYPLITEVIKKIYNRFNVLIAPRHLDSSALDDLSLQLMAANVPLGKRSDQATFKQYPTLILDSIGDLREYYGLGTINIIGGGLGEHSTRGSHNPLESLIYSVPTIIGHDYRRHTLIVEKFSDSPLLIQMKQSSPAELEETIWRTCDKMLSPEYLDTVKSHTQILGHTSQITRDAIQEIIGYLKTPAKKG